MQFFLKARQPPSGPRPHPWGSSITLRHTTLGRTPLGEWSAHHRDPYLTTHNTHKRETSSSPAGFEPAIPADERPQTHVLDRAASRTGRRIKYRRRNVVSSVTASFRRCVNETTLFWNVTQRRVVVCYRRLGTTYLEYGTDRLSGNVGKKLCYIQEDRRSLQIVLLSGLLQYCSVMQGLYLRNRTFLKQENCLLL